jgi:Lrp/AsnC family leucine-responsive transcriptional regulator
MDLDELDLKILQTLTQSGRVTWADLAQSCGVSSPAIADRVRRLEKRGVIQGYTVQLAPQSLGYDLTAFVSVSLDRPEHRPSFLHYIQTHPAIQECHHIAGDGDYLLKVRCPKTVDLERILSDEIKGLPGVVKTQTTIVLSTVKETTALEF